MDYTPPVDGVAVAKLTQARQSSDSPLFWFPEDDLVFSELYSLLDKGGAKGPFGETFVRMSYYANCSIIPGSTAGCEYPYYGQPAAPAWSGGSVGEGNPADAAASLASAAAPSTRIDKTQIILTAD